MGCAPSQDAAQLGQLTSSGERRAGTASSGWLLPLRARDCKRPESDVAGQ